MNRLLIDHGRIINEGQTFDGAVVIEGEKISEVLRSGEKPRAACDTVIDGSGACLMPGVIDDHVHFRDPGLTHKADMVSESRAAAAGGVTSFMDMPNTNPQTTTLETLENKFRDSALKSRVNYSFYFGATNNNAPLLKELDRNQVCGVKLFMGSSTGNMLVDRMEALRTIFREAGMIIVKTPVATKHFTGMTRMSGSIRKYEMPKPATALPPWQSGWLKRPEPVCTSPMSALHENWNFSAAPPWSRKPLPPKPVSHTSISHKMITRHWAHASNATRPSKALPTGMHCAVH